MLLSNPSTEFGFGAARTRTEFGSKNHVRAKASSCSWPGGTADGNFYRTSVPVRPGWR